MSDSEPSAEIIARYERSGREMSRFWRDYAATQLEPERAAAIGEADRIDAETDANIARARSMPPGITLPQPD